MATGDERGPWQLLEYPGEFRLAVPAASEWFEDDDGNAFVVRLPTRPVTDIRVSRHGRPDDVGLPWLEGRVRRFFDDSVPRATGAALQGSIQPCVTQANAVQGVATRGDGTWWLVRAYLVPRDYFWVQWNGPEPLLKSFVLEVVESFEPTRPVDA